MKSQPSSEREQQGQGDMPTDPGCTSLASAMHLRGVELIKAGNAAQAQQILTEAVSTQRDDPDLWNSLAVAYQKTGRHRDAVQCLLAAIHLKPDVASFHANLADSYAQLHEHRLALQHYQSAQAAGMNNAVLMFNQGRIHQCLGDVSQAFGKYQEALHLDPENVNALNNLANILVEAKRYSEAIQLFNKIIELQADNAEAHNNRGCAQMKLRNFSDAMADFRRAIRLKENYLEAVTNMGIALQEIGAREAALSAFETVIEKDAKDAQAHWNKSLVLLQMGRFDKGWEEYEWRDRRREITTVWPKFPYPRWNKGQQLDGKTLLVHSEQGLGDTLQFCRFLLGMDKYGVRVIFQVPAPLLDLMRTLPCNAVVVQKDGHLPHADFECPLMSLPYMLDIGPQEFSSNVPYLRAEEIKNYADVLGTTKRKLLKIGVAWSGNPQHPSDSLRSMSLKQMTPLLNLEADWVILQKEIRMEEYTQLGNYRNLKHFPEHLNDFSSTASLLQSLDLVVTVDTSIAHLAGALGKKTFLMLHANPDWRWQLDRTDSPWYPTMTLFRQEQPGQWTSVLDAVARTIEALT